jgi:hypothetical protein
VYAGTSSSPDSLVISPLQELLSLRLPVSCVDGSRTFKRRAGLPAFQGSKRKVWMSLHI